MQISQNINYFALTALLNIVDSKEMSTNQNTEQKIMDAAEKMFLEKGYIMSTTTSIAKEAGVTHAMLHYYFRTKEQIFVKVLNKNLGELTASLRPIMTLRRPAWDTLKEGLEMFFDFLSSHRQLPGLIYDVINYNPQLLKSYIQTLQDNEDRMLKYHKEMLEKEIETGKINPISIEQIYYDIITMNMSVFMSLSAMKNLFDVSPGCYETFLDTQKNEIINKIHYRLYGKLE